MPIKHSCVFHLFSDIRFIKPRKCCWMIYSICHWEKSRVNLLDKRIGHIFNNIYLLINIHRTWQCDVCYCQNRTLEYANSRNYSDCPKPWGNRDVCNANENTVNKNGIHSSHASTKGISTPNPWIVIKIWRPNKPNISMCLLRPISLSISFRLAGNMVESITILRRARF